MKEKNIKVLNLEKLDFNNPKYWSKEVLKVESGDVFNVNSTLKFKKSI